MVKLSKVLSDAEMQEMDEDLNSYCNGDKMKYIVHYWVGNWEQITGHAKGDEISEEQLMTLIREQKVNVLIHHAPAHGDVPARSYCYIDDLRHRFQQR